MPNKKPPATDKDLIRAITDSFNEVEPDSPEEINAILRDAGYDPDQVARQMKAVAERALKESPLNWRERTQEMEDAKSRLIAFTSALPTSRAEIINAIKELVAKLGSGKSELAMAQYRNFESASDEDLASLLRQLQYLSAQENQRADGNKN